MQPSSRCQHMWFHNCSLRSNICWLPICASRIPHGMQMGIPNGLRQACRMQCSLPSIWANVHTLCKMSCVAHSTMERIMCGAVQVCGAFGEFDFRKENKVTRYRTKTSRCAVHRYTGQMCQFRYQGQLKFTTGKVVGAAMGRWDSGRASNSHGARELCRIRY